MGVVLQTPVFTYYRSFYWNQPGCCCCCCCCCCCVFFTCSMGIYRFRLGQLINFFKPLGTWLNWLKTMGITIMGSYPLCKCQQTPSCVTRLESGAHYPQEYGRVFNSFNRKRLKCVLLVHFTTCNNLKFLITILEMSLRSTSFFKLGLHFALLWNGDIDGDKIYML